MRWNHIQDECARVQVFLVSELVGRFDGIIDGLRSLVAVARGSVGSVCGAVFEEVEERFAHLSVCVHHERYEFFVHCVRCVLILTVLRILAYHDGVAAGGIAVGLYMLSGLFHDACHKVPSRLRVPSYTLRLAPHFTRLLLCKSYRLEVFLPIYREALSRNNRHRGYSQVKKKNFDLQ